MNSHDIRIALVSSNEHLRTKVQESIRDARTPVRIELDIPRAPGSLEPEELDRIRAVDPHVVILDMSDDPHRAIRVAGALGSRSGRAALVGVGPELDSGALLDAMRAGVVEYVPHPAEPAALYEALGRVVRKRGWTGSSTENHKGKVLAFFSGKGGSGCTSVATNLGIELHEMTDKKTLLVDLDLELGEIASLLGIQPRFHFVDLVRNFHRMDADLLTSYIESHESGIQVLSAPFEPEIGAGVTREQITQILEFLRSHYDYVLVDASKSLAPPALGALQVADRIFLIANADVPSVRNLKRCMPFVTQVTDGDTNRLRLVVNRHTNKSLVGLKDLEETLDLDVYATLCNDYKTVIEAMSTGRPLVLNGSSRYADQIRDLAADIVDEFEGVRPGSQRSLMGRLLAPFRSNGNASEPRVTVGSSPEEISAHG